MSNMSATHIINVIIFFKIKFISLIAFNTLFFMKNIILETTKITRFTLHFRLNFFSLKNAEFQRWRTSYPYPQSHMRNVAR
jgi:hypothetical protein